MRLPIALALLGAAASLAAETPAQPDQASADRILDSIRVLSSDAFEGRAPGTPGEDKAVAYIQGQFAALGLLPGNPDGTFIQKVPTVGIVSQTSASFSTGAGTLTPVWVNDYVAVTRNPVPRVEVKDSPIVFVGYGVIAPEYNWDDFKGVDVRGKTVVMLINDPPVPDPKDPTKLDDTVFKGKTMTYYGRWTYKYEQATAQGAAACIIVHETGPAAYPFGVVAASWGRENFTLHTPGGAGETPVEGWITYEFAKKFFAAAGFDYAVLKASAVHRDFRPVELHAKATFTVATTVRPLDSRNIVAKLEGSDPARRSEYIIYSAHWDHLGRNPHLHGDQIYNGAADNASGVASLLEIARLYTSLPPEQRPKRSILFLSTTAEEQGLLGARYYALHPLYPLTKTVADINMDVMQRSGPSHSLEIVGYGLSTLDDLASEILREHGRIPIPDTQPEKGSFYRADQFEFAKVGIPGLYTSGGLDIIGKPEGYGLMRRDQYTAEDYHKVSDEIKPWWDLRGTAADTDFLFEAGLRLAQDGTWPQWKAGAEYKARRDAMMAQ